MSNVRLTKKRLLALGAVAALALAALGGTALAGHVTGGVKSYTGCLITSSGTLTKVKEGDSPLATCTSGQVPAHFSGGDITSITGGTGIQVTNGTNGAATVSLDTKYGLRQDCADGQVVEWQASSSSWVCANDDDTKYTAGTGLGLSLSNAFSIEPAFRVKNTPDCSSGQFATGFDSSGSIQCAAPASGGVQAFSAHVGETTLAGETVVISKTLPAGTYLLFASVALINRDGNDGGDGFSAASCTIPGYTTGTQELNWNGDGQGVANTEESLALSSALNHAGGGVELRCTELSANVDVFNATLTAIKVDSLG